MSKSILVIDTPKSCRDCRFSVAFSEHFGNLKCVADNELKGCSYYEFANKIHPQCPLQDTTELLEALEELQEDLNVCSDKDKDHYGDKWKAWYNVRINKLHKALGG